MEELIESYGELIRTLNRISNNNKDVLLQCDIKRIEKAKTILPKFAQGGAQWERSVCEPNILEQKGFVDVIKLSIESENFAQRRTGRKGSSYYNGLAAGYREGYLKRASEGIEELFRKAFEAGRTWQIAETAEFHGGKENEKPDFDEWYKSKVENLNIPLAVKSCNAKKITVYLKNPKKMINEETGHKWFKHKKITACLQGDDWYECNGE